MDLSTIVYIVGALAYALLRGYSKREPQTIPTPSPGPVVFSPPQAPLPIPHSAKTVPQDKASKSNARSSQTSPYPSLFREGSERFASSASQTENKSAGSPKNDFQLANDLQTIETQAPENQFRKPDPNEWRRAIILSTLLEPKFDQPLNQ
jgi:hypothetical protein